MRNSAGIRVAFIVFAELLGTSLWFVGTAVAPDVSVAWSLGESGRAMLLTATQLGFILGTLGLSLTGLADRFRSHHLFALSSLFGAAINLGFLLCDSLLPALVCRFLVGVCLAGIYPLGMKLVVSWAPQTAGLALGWLVGALTVGTSLPFLLRGLDDAIPWRSAVIVASVLALLAGGVIAWVGEGPFVKSGGKLGWSKVRNAFQEPRFRASALAYFGHMWELYAFWSLVPVFVNCCIDYPGSKLAYRTMFSIIAVGGLGCVLGGMLSRRIGNAPVAAVALVTSAAMCFAFPFTSGTIAWAVLLMWGFAVVADSPQFSAMSAAASPPDSVGSGLAVQNGLGFAVTVVAIQLAAFLQPHYGPRIAWLLLPGPVFGYFALRPLLRKDTTP